MMKSNPFESWEKQLNTLLNEGITVSSSTGQQGMPDSVSINATDADAQELLAIVRQAGLGVFGNGEQPTSAYGAPMDAHSAEPAGHGAEPEASPAVVGDGDDMLSLIKKMTVSPEASSDYEDEEGHDHGEEACADCGQSPCACDDEEMTDEGNAFSGAVAKAKADGIQPGEKISVGGKEYPVKEEDEEESMEEGHDHEGMCQECGYMEDKCQCDDEQVEESFANSADDKSMQDLQYMIQTLSGGLNKPKTMHKHGYRQNDNPMTAPMAESVDLLKSYQKLSGIK
jgi:hypothetical protein